MSLTPNAHQQPLLAQALSSVANAILITDETGRIVWVNDAFSRLSGYAPEEAIGHTPALLQSGRQSRAFYADLWRTIREGKVWQGEVIDQRKDGSTYTTDEIITPLFDEHGAITHFIAIQHDITVRKQESEWTRHLAYHDALTGLPNRSGFLDVQERAIAHAKRTQLLLAMLFVDLDHFKPVNDTLGHHTGDQLLKAVADRLRAGVRKEDTVARFGGDEFAILLAGLADSDVAAGLAQKLCEALSRPFVLRGQTIRISASIGIALYPADGEDAESLLAHADQAMYQAKQQGGNNYQVYHADAPQSH